MTWTDVIGSLAAVLTTCAFLPQAIKTLRSKETSDISLAMYVMFCGGTTLWLVYGVMIRAYPVIVANAVTMLFAASVLALKVRHG